MATIEQLEARLRPYKLALIEAFGLDPEKTWAAMSIVPESATFHVIDVQPSLHPTATVRGDDEDASVEFESRFWTDEQRQAVEDYLRQFPRLKFSVKGDPEELQKAFLAAEHGKIMVLPDDGGLKITRTPTWRDVFRAMRAAGFKLKVEESEGRYRKWWVDEGTGGIIAEIWRQHLGGRDTWTVEIIGYLLRRVYLDDPEPAAVLAAAMLTRLIDGPVCGVDVTGLAEFTRKDQP